MLQVFTEKEFNDIEDKARETPEGNDTLDFKYTVDKVIRDLGERGIVPPFNLPGDPLTDHFISINENLFIAYPYYFNSVQLTELEKNAKEKGFSVIVDPIASRYRGGNLRIIIWKYNEKSLVGQKNAKK